MSLRKLDSLVWRILPPLTQGGNVVLLLGWRDLVWMFFVTVVAVLVLLYLLDCVCRDEATTD